MNGVSLGLYSAVTFLMGKRNREKEEEKKEGKGSKKRREKKKRKGKRREMKKIEKRNILAGVEELSQRLHHAKDSTRSPRR